MIQTPSPAAGRTTAVTCRSCRSTRTTPLAKGAPGWLCQDCGHITPAPAPASEEHDA